MDIVDVGIADLGEKVLAERFRQEVGLLGLDIQILLSSSVSTV